MKKTFLLVLVVLFLISGVVNAQTFWAGNIQYEVDDAQFIGSIPNRDFLSLADRDGIISFRTTLQQSTFAPAGLRITSFNLRAANQRTTAENQIVQWTLNNCINLGGGHRVGDTYRIIASRTDQWIGYVIVFNYVGNNNWNNIMFSFSAQ